MLVTKENFLKLDQGEGVVCNLRAIALAVSKISCKLHPNALYFLFLLKHTMTKPLVTCRQSLSSKLNKNFPN